MKYTLRGVQTSFNIDYVRKVARDVFIEKNKGKVWQDAPEDVRLTALGEVWDMAQPTPKGEATLPEPPKDRTIVEAKPKSKKRNNGTKGHSGTAKDV